MRRRSSAVSAAVSLFLLCSLVVFGGAGPADAVVPAAPSGEHVVAATATSFTVAVNAAADATSYRVFAARTRPELYVANITSATQSATSTSPRIPVTGLTYTSAILWYRVETLNATSHHWGELIHPAGLQPPAPSGLHAVAGDIGTYLTWNPEATGTGFVVTQAIDAAMTGSRVSRAVGSQTYQYTPFALRKGVTYYFQVRAKNVDSLSTYSARVAVTPLNNQTSLRVMTYNVLEGDSAGTVAGGQVIPPWSERRAGVAALIKQGNPDVVAIQEAAAWATSLHAYEGVRQIDDLMPLLPGYALARTEIPPTEHYYQRTGVYIVYKTAAFQPVGPGGHWSIGDGRWAAYQVLQSRASGAKCLFVSTHETAGGGATNDTLRQAETTSLLTQATAVAGAAHVRVVYAGDFNSNTNSNHAFDGVGIAMRGPRNTDALAVAVHSYNTQYDSANGYLRRPWLGQKLDYVFVSLGVAVWSWGSILNLTDGAFVGTIPSDHNPVWATISIV